MTIQTRFGRNKFIAVLLYSHFGAGRTNILHQYKGPVVLFGKKTSFRSLIKKIKGKTPPPPLSTAQIKRK